MWGLISGPLFPFTRLSDFASVVYCFDDCGCVICFEIRKCKASNSVLLKIVLVIHGPLRFHVNFGIMFPVSAKNAVGILIGIALNF